MKVSTSQEVGLVSKLKAARLIEAKMEAPPDARGRYWPAREATVYAITDEGLDAVADHIAENRTALERLFIGGGMPIDYVREIANSQFPLRVEDSARAQKIQILAAAGFLEARLVYKGQEGDSEPRGAVLVVNITPLGRRAIEQT
jgi:DNA-binding PadR family transcriptional regulator